MAAVNTVCTAYGCERIDIERWRAVFGRPLTRAYERVLERELDKQDWKSIDVLYHDSYRELLHTCGLAPGALEVLREWVRAGGTQSLLSMWFHDELVPMVTEYGLNPFLSRVDGNPDSTAGGSKAEHLVRHLDALDLEPSAVVLIGDVVDDAHAAQRVGAECVLVTTGVMNRSALAETGFPVVDSVAEAVETIRDERAA